MNVEPRQIFMRERERPHEVFSLLEGWAFSFRLLPDGQRQILSFFFPGDFISFQGLRTEPLHFSAQALTRLRLCAFDTESMREFLRAGRDVCWHAMIASIQRSSQLEFRILDLGRRSALQRVASFILKLDRRLMAENRGLEDIRPFPLRQEHFADALGLTKVHISRTISELRKKGLVTLTQGSILIHDRTRLADVAGIQLHRDNNAELHNLTE